MEPSDHVMDGPLAGEFCDGCGTDAVIRVVLGSGGMLVFCPECWTKHQDALRELATAVRG